MNNRPARHLLLPFILGALLTAPPPSAGTWQPAVHRAAFPEIYRIPLRIHLGNSSRSPQQWLPILEEINSIWLSQAGICFEMHTTHREERLEHGMDLWFDEMIPDWNGYYRGKNDMHVRDDPDLRPATMPARFSAARTAAHELGHALALPHRQDSDDNLMRSKTYGWLLHEEEIAVARNHAANLALADAQTNGCSVFIHSGRRS